MKQLDSERVLGLIIPHSRAVSCTRCKTASVSGSESTLWRSISEPQSFLQPFRSLRPGKLQVLIFGSMKNVACISLHFNGRFAHTTHPMICLAAIPCGLSVNTIETTRSYLSLTVQYQYFPGFGQPT